MNKVSQKLFFAITVGCLFILGCATTQKTTIVEIKYPDKVFEYGKFKYEVNPGDELEVMYTKTCRGGYGECWVIRNVKTNELGVVSANRMKKLHKVYKVAKTNSASHTDNDPGSENLYSIYSKDVDWVYLDSTITEIDRRERTSLLKLKNFTQNSGMEGRFLFCFILSLAEIRGFRYWMSSEELNEQILVVFLNSEDENFKNILEDKYKEFTLYDLVADSESEEWKMLKNMCGPKW